VLFEAFKKMRRERAEEPAFLVAAGDRSLPISWRQFTDDISAVAVGILSRCPGGKIALLGENSYEWIVAHAATIFSGAVAVPIDVNLSAAEIAARLDKVGASALVYSALYAEKAAAVGRLCPKVVVSAFGSSEAETFIAEAKARLRAGEASVFDGPGPDTAATSMIVFTSGTTSEPRGAELAVDGLSAFAAFAGMQLKLSPGKRSLMLLPLFHIYGIAATYAMLSAGVVLGICPDYRRIYDALVRFKADFVFLVPALADILTAKIEQRERNTAVESGRLLEWICSGGAPLSPRTHERLNALGIKVVAAYGLTETTALFAISSLEEGASVGSAGKVCNLPEVEAKVSPSGELLIRGPNVLKRYYGEKDASASPVDSDGFLHTGDAGRIDGDGTVWVTGRLSRTIVLSSGKKVAPEELETKILLHPGINEVVVRGDGERREISAEIFASVPDEEVYSAISALNGSLPTYKRIKKVFIRKKPFPRTASGKISLAKMASGGKSQFSWSSWLMVGAGVVSLVVFVVEIIAWRYAAAQESRTMSLVYGISEAIQQVMLVLVAVALFVCARKFSRMIRSGGRRRRPGGEK
jgi:long-chain acyl-CoA synthetase